MQQKLVEMEKGWKNVERKYMEDQKGLGSNVEYLVLVRLTLEITFVGILNFPRDIYSAWEGGRLVFLMTCTSWKEQTFYHSIVSEAVCHL